MQVTGYKGICCENGIFVKKEDAYQYALERCLQGTPEDQKEFREMLEEWFYSGNFLPVTIEEMEENYAEAI